jgi:epoxyqueuosine reductase
LIGVTGLERHVKELGRDAGFDLVRIGRATDMHLERTRYLEWIEAGRQGEMRWITPERAALSADPNRVLKGARSVISVGLSYWAGHPSPRPHAGKIAKYAWGRDYHAVMGDQLREFTIALARTLHGDHRWYVDTGPQMDKALAARSGLGWVGKNTNIITEEFGSYVLLGEVITTLDLAPDPALKRDCGSCRLCQVACPTGALGPDYSIDSRKCISYLTIEFRGSIPREFRPLIGAWVFGCDICQDVCPPAVAPFLHSAFERRAWAQETRMTVSRKASPGWVRWGLSPAPADVRANLLHAGGLRTSVDLVWLLQLTHEQYLEAFRSTALRRAKAWMLRRNAAIALGNVGDEISVEALSESVRTDVHPIVRGHAAWALGVLGTRFECPGTCEMLAGALATETDRHVRTEIEEALDDLTRRRDNQTGDAAL